MSESGKKYSVERSGHKFVIQPLSVGGYVLMIDGQLGRFYYKPEGAVQDCKSGHVEMVIAPIPPRLKPYLVSTKGLDPFPANLTGWDESNELPLEMDL